jgi:hypothetical protein
MPKLNQVIAVASTKKSAAKSELERAYHTLQKPDLFSGLHKVYKPKNEDGDRLPEESKKIQQKVVDVIASVEEAWTNMVDVVVTNDSGNANAKADVVVNGAIILESVPVTSLIFLEKQLTDLATLVNNIPVLPESLEWTYDSGAGIYRSNTIDTNRSKKVQKPIVLYPHSEHHAAQTQLITEDENVGTWSTTALSSALTANQVKEVRGRVAQLKEAVVKAREEANNTEVENRAVGAKAFSFIFHTIL